MARLLLLAAAVAMLLQPGGASTASAQTGTSQQTGAAASENRADLIQDRPRTLGKAWSYAAGVAEQAFAAVGSALSFVAPPSPATLASGGADQRGSTIIGLLGIAGYKLKEIHNDVGVIPGLSFKFAMVREMSEADHDFLEERLHLLRQQNPGVIGTLQDGIVSTVVAINSGGGMQVSELKLKLLPLPGAEFSLTPAATVLGEEASALMDAIQRVDKRIRALGSAEAKMAPSASLTPSH